MSFPPPPGLKQAPSSLPPRPPATASTASPSNFQPAYSAAPSGASNGFGGHGSRAGYSAITAFQPRSVASSQPYRTSSPAVSAPPTTSTSGYSTPTTGSYGGYYSQAQSSYQSGPSYYGASQYNDNTYGPSVPHIQNPFTPAADQSSAYGRGRNFGRNDSGLDPETEAQIAQWQSAYANKEEVPATGKAPGRPTLNQGMSGAGSGVNTPSGANTTASTPAPTVGNPEPASKTVARAGGGQNWTDSTLLEWDPAHFRLFVGNLAGEVTDDSLLKAFAKYTSVQKARVIRDKRTQKSKGYGFVSFSDGDDYFKAAREMQGKYIGSHPVLLRRATTEVRPVSNTKNGKKHGSGGGSGGGAGSGKVKHDGVKKHGKTKGGLRIIG
ncbi:RNA-binding domain-containing protein [Aspergillus sclerotioniger CBS 115572]|uniref:RNA-binding domain-containing protein n=1 Tax=Aspergillus sclerotioniger CBS 115572 TaxID=1450535 RepID=A0A317X2P7_9EURO|nr:RNA-binding domain-containing protein [Aspergillus sclerotioniger CBS 115572]PWY91892.1 RNA-binding domain-containing protein [Aspergillus sclerotioniger CBS 115572]